MQAMQYFIDLPADYDMEIIKERVRKNGAKTDGFKDLLFKAYLIAEKETGALANSYCPLYVWQETEGMTRFIFDGYFDNITASFGAKNINIGITSKVELGHSFVKSQFVIEEYREIPNQTALKNFAFETETYPEELGKVVIYNPEKWRYVTFTFFENKPVITQSEINVYSLLHLSLGE